MLTDSLLPSLSYIFAGAAVISTLALFTRQSLIIAYMVLGMVLGPFGLQWVKDAEMVQHIGHVGMIFLLFLAGLHLDPKNLLPILKNMVVVTVTTSLVFAILGYLIVINFTSLGQMDAIIIGGSMMFSSTLIGLKLLPNNVLHSQHLGEVMISILLIQDLLAIAMMVALKTMSNQDIGTDDVAVILVAIPALLMLAFVLERFLLSWLFNRFEPVREYLFILSVGWCLSLAQLANTLGLSHEVGAFIAGVSIASGGSVSTYLAECLSPIRDFFLVLFFFSIGAELDLSALPGMIMPIMMLTVVVLLVKPLMYWLLLQRTEDDRAIGFELGCRLGQGSEFSVLVTQIANQHALIVGSAAVIVQATTMLSFMLSSYWVVRNYLTPNQAVQRNRD